MEKARQYSVVMQKMVQPSGPVRTMRATMSVFAPRKDAVWPQIARYILGHDMWFAQDVRDCAEMRRLPESLLPHCIGFALEPVENKQFSANVSARDVDIALSWGQGGNDHWQPCTARGRQEKWYKDYWPSQSLHLWRLWAFRAAKTALRCKAHRRLLQHRRSLSTATFTSIYCFGRAFGPVRHPLSPEDVAYG